jgi:hypothetical protein
MNKPIQQVWTFPSDSDPTVEYQTLQYADGTTSCNCKGWTRRIASDGSRSCKHTRWVDLKVADHHCTATRNYRTEKARPDGNIPPIRTLPRIGKRKFAV